VKRAILTHRVDFVAIAVLVVAAVATVLYILEHQPAFTFGRSYYVVKVPFANAAAVTAGQGQSVTIAGVEVGLVGGVALHNGHAVVTMDLFKRYAPIYRNATVLLRPRTPLKDMYLALDPGTRSAGAVPAGGMLSLANTQPDVDVDQILGSLDADTRTYLLLLLSGGAQAFAGPGAHGGTPSGRATSELAAIFKRFVPLDRDTKTFASLLATRNVRLARAIHNLNLVVGSLGGVDHELASLVRASNANFGAISSQDAALEAGLTQLPPTLAQTNTTLGQVGRFAAATGPTLHKLLPFAHELAPALAAVRPLVRDTTPAIQHQLRPFTTAVTPLARELAPAAAKLTAATPPLVSSIDVFNHLFNTLAYNPGGGQSSYLFWGSWLAHNAASLTDTQDANGPIVRGLFMASCPQLNLLEVTLPTSDPALAPILDLLNAPDWKTIKSPYCPAAGAL
jgi:phospholipid/cholesterol/gamma-HCH transport system substrate-binding protein